MGNAIIRSLFHLDPGKLTLRRWMDLAGASAKEVLTLQYGRQVTRGENPVAESPHTFNG